MIKNFSICALVIFVGHTSFAQDVPIEAVAYLSEADITEIKELTDLAGPDSYSFELLDDGLKVNISGAVALEMMGYSKDTYVEPLWGLIEGRNEFDIRKTNATAKTIVVGQFECVQKRWPQKSDGLDYLWFQWRLHATAMAEPLQLTEVLNEYNVCSKVYH